MAYSECTKQTILFHWLKGLKPSCIVLQLKEEGTNVSGVGVWKFIKRYELNESILRKPGSGQPSHSGCVTFGRQEDGGG